jgi:hypothetical protein
MRLRQQQNWAGNFWIKVDLNLTTDKSYEKLSLKISGAVLSVNGSWTARKCHQAQHRQRR